MADLSHETNLAATETPVINREISVETEKDSSADFYAAVSAIARFIEAADKDAPEGAAPKATAALLHEMHNESEILTELESEIHHKSENHLV